MNDHEAFRRPEGDKPARPRRGVVEDAPQVLPARGSPSLKARHTNNRGRCAGSIPTPNPSRRRPHVPAVAPVSRPLPGRSTNSPTRLRARRRAVGLEKILALLLTLLLLVLGGWWWSRHDASPTALVSPAPSTSTAVSASAAPKPAVEPSVTPAAAPAAPHRGARAGNRRRCAASSGRPGILLRPEKRPAMESWLCTRYDKDPAMFAYVGGASGHRTGRVSLNVQSVGGTRNAGALGLQTGSPSRLRPRRRRVRRPWPVAPRSGTPRPPPAPSARGGAATGRSSSTWTVGCPRRRCRADLLPAKPFVPTLTARGYTCSASTCTRSSGGLEYTVDYRVKGLGVTHLR